MTQQAEVSEGPIRLAHVAPFRLGAVEVHPPTRQIVRGGKSETIEPRVMQVLVALAQADGAILTREALIERCWDGRIVSENAINRVISRVRQIAAGLGPDSFQLETITKVGYRIVVGQETSHRPALPPAPGAGGKVDRRLLLGGALLLAAGAGGAALLWPRPAPDEARTRAARLVARGRELMDYGLPDRSAQAVAYFREATRVDPDFAEAWGALALAEESVARGRSAAQRALALDPGNVDARAALVLAEPQYGRWAEREADYRRFHRDFPTEPNVHFQLGHLMTEVGRWNDAIGLLTGLTGRDGFLPMARYRLINALWSAGRLQEADNALDEALRRWPQHGAIWQTRFRVLMHTGRATAAIALATDAATRPLDHDVAGFAPNLATARALQSGAAVDIAQAVSLNLARVEREPGFAYTAAQNCAGLGQTDAAFQLFDGYYFGRGRWAAARPGGPFAFYTLFLFYPSAAALWRDRRFAALTEEIGLDAYWRASRTSPDFRRTG